MGEVKAGPMSYRITKADPVEGGTVELMNRDGNAGFFKNAAWIFRVKSAPEGSRLICAADGFLATRYFFLGRILYAKSGSIRLTLRACRREATPAGTRQ